MVELFFKWSSLFSKAINMHLPDSKDSAERQYFKLLALPSSYSPYSYCQTARILSLWQFHRPSCVISWFFKYFIRHIFALMSKKYKRGRREKKSLNFGCNNRRRLLKKIKRKEGELRNEETIYVLTALTLIAGAMAIIRQRLGAGITGSPHDFSADLWTADLRDLPCCHVPHDHGRTLAIQPHSRQWFTVEPYVKQCKLHIVQQPHTRWRNGQPTGISKMCLGCHDEQSPWSIWQQIGRQSPDNHLYPGWYPVTGASMDAGTNLKGTHPISITYETTWSRSHSWKPLAELRSGSLEAVQTSVLKLSRCPWLPGESVAGTHLLRAAIRNSLRSLSDMSCKIVCRF